MANENSKILTTEEEIQLRQPIEDYVGEIQTKIDRLRAGNNPDKAEISRLVADAENYLKEHFDQDYYQKVKSVCERQKTRYWRLTKEDLPN